MPLLSLTTTSYTIKALSLFLSYIGTSSLALGISSAVSEPDRLRTNSPESRAANSVIDSTLRYNGALITGLAATGWWAANDIPERKAVLVIAGVAIVGSGVGRALSGWQHGFGAAFLKRAMWVELVVPFVLWGIGSWS